MLPETVEVNSSECSSGGHHIEHDELSLVGESTIAELPLNGRNYVDLTLLQPGITQHTQENAGQGIAGTMYSSDGAPARSNIVTLDGTLTVNSGGLNASSIARHHPGHGRRQGVQGRSPTSPEPSTSPAGRPDHHRQQKRHQSADGDVFEYLRNDVLDAQQLLRSADSQSGIERSVFLGSRGTSSAPPWAVH